MDYLVFVTFGIALIVLAGAGSIAFIGHSSLTSIARQPAKSADMRITTIVLIALVEGITLFALVICMMVVLGIRSG